MKRIHLLATAALALAVAAPAIAQIGPPGMKGSHGAFGLLEFDTNADGKITKAELDTNLKTRFGEIDANKDGTATREEAKAAMEGRRATMEAARFTALDTDKNGQLSAVEFAAAKGGPGGGPDGKRGPAGFRGPGGQGGPGGPRGDRAGPANDAGQTFADFSKRPLEMFARADANKDGTVTIAELQAQSPGRAR